MLKLLKYVKKYLYFAILATTVMFLEVFMYILLTLFMVFSLILHPLNFQMI